MARCFVSASPDGKTECSCTSREEPMSVGGRRPGRTVTLTGVSHGVQPCPLRLPRRCPQALLTRGALIALFSVLSVTPPSSLLWVPSLSHVPTVMAGSRRLVRSVLSHHPARSVLCSYTSAHVGAEREVALSSVFLTALCFSSLCSCL